MGLTSDAFSLLDNIYIYIYIFPGGPKPCNDVFLNEVCHGCSNGLFQKDDLYLFCKILSGYQDPYMAIGMGVYRPYKIKSLSI